MTKIKIKIEKGIAIPTPSGRGAPKYPWHEMEIGDSFFLKKDVVPMSRMYSHISQANKRYAPKKFTLRKLENGVRIWRTK